MKERVREIERGSEREAVRETQRGSERERESSEEGEGGDRGQLKRKRSYYSWITFFLPSFHVSKQLIKTVINS